MKNKHSQIPAHEDLTDLTPWQSEIVFNSTHQNRNTNHIDQNLTLTKKFLPSIITKDIKSNPKL